MGADIKLLRTRIKSVDSTLHLTRAMGLVASSKIRRATQEMLHSRAYAEGLSACVEPLSRTPMGKKHPFFVERSGERTRLIVIAGDRGLAGGYNANVFRLVREFSDAEILAVGKRTCDRYSQSPLFAEHFSIDDARAIGARCCEEYLTGAFDRLGVVYTHYHSVMSQEARVKWILPFVPNTKGDTREIVFEPNEEELRRTIVEQYVVGTIFALVKESFAGEVAARRVAMDNAGRNAQEMIDSLSLAYNRARQSAITQEITEIVAGSGR